MHEGTGKGDRRQREKERLRKKGKAERERKLYFWFDRRQDQFYIPERVAGPLHHRRLQCGTWRII